MIQVHVRKTQAIDIVVVAIFCLAASEALAAASQAIAPEVTYTASGIFGNPISGADVFKLAGEPFSISVVASAATVPKKHGAQWAQYTELKMTGAVTTGLEPTPFLLSSDDTSIELATGNPSYDVFELFAPITVVGIHVTILAHIQVPAGTIANAHIHPFGSVALGGSDTVTYSDAANGASTTLGIAEGTLVATIPGGTDNKEAPIRVQLHAGGAEAITLHADGTESVRPIGAAPVDLGASSDAVALQFYASGVRDGSGIHVRIAGQDVPLLYAGPAGHFPGLDQLSVKVPRSLAGSGNVEVELSVDGRAANTVNIQIQ
jgi:hypothetical protein